MSSQLPCGGLAVVLMKRIIKSATCSQINPKCQKKECDSLSHNVRYWCHSVLLIPKIKEGETIKAAGESLDLSFPLICSSSTRNECYCSLDHRNCWDNYTKLWQLFKIIRIGTFQRLFFSFLLFCSSLSLLVGNCGIIIIVSPCDENWYWKALKIAVTRNWHDITRETAQNSNCNQR